jgi:hypothetical protein
MQNEATTLDLWWAVPGALAGMSMPFLHPDRRETGGAPLEAFDDELSMLERAGIGAVVSLLNIPVDAAVYTSAGFSFYMMPIKDGAAPSIEQFNDFLVIMRGQSTLGNVTAVHCAAGIGRTGTVLAGYSIAGGATPEAAIECIRRARPGAIETPHQMQFLYELHQARVHL